MSRKSHNRVVPQLDSLEGRQLLTATTVLRQGVLIIQGDRAADVVSVTEDRGRVEVHGSVRRGSPVSFALRDVRKVLFVGGAGNDRFVDDTPIPATALGGAGNDFLVGGGGRDDLRGDAGDDSLFGRAGDDHIEGDLGDDRLFGNDGDDDLEDHRGRNRFNGGHGADDVAGGLDQGHDDPGDRNDDRGGVRGGGGRDDAGAIAAMPGADDTVHPEDNNRQRGRQGR